MSDDSNTKLLERAAELMDEIESHPSGYAKLLEQAVAKNDFDAIRYAVSRVETELSREHFTNFDIIVW